MAENASTRQPRSSELKVGDVVNYASAVFGTLQGAGRILKIDGDQGYFVDWGRVRFWEYNGSHLIRVCVNCHLLEEDHADGGKCLYDPGYFVPLRVEL